ncbi:MAG: ABC transporter substrate-binding protein [Devosia sp.]
MLKSLAAAALAVALSSFVAMAAEWTYTDGSGKIVALNHVPTKIVAHANSAAGLLAFGIRPVGLYADRPVADEPSLKGLDLSGITILGEAWGEIDLEKLAALQPDLIVAEYWPLEKAYSGMEQGGGQSGALIEQIAPVAGPAQGDSMVTLIDDYAALAQRLGADPAIAAAEKAAFEAKKTAFQAAVSAKPNLTAMAMWAGDDGLYVASPNGSSELADFKRWGLNIITPENADDRGYWETLSWETADKYQPDLILVDDRQGPATRKVAESKPTWTTIKAAAAGQVSDWPAFWIRTWTQYAEQLDKLTATINATDENLTN